MDQSAKDSFSQWLRRSSSVLSFHDRDDLLYWAIKAHDEAGVPASIVRDDLLSLSSDMRAENIPPLGTSECISAEATESIAPHLSTVFSPRRTALPLPLGPNIKPHSLPESTKKHHIYRPSLWDRLPNELISNIFLTGVRDERYEGRRESRRFNLTVSHVSRRWREVSLSTGMMWQFFTMTDIGHEYNWTNLCLKRCGTAPLDFQLTWTLVGSRPMIRTQQDFINQLDILFSCVHQWRDVCITVDRHVALLAFVKRFEVVGHSLRRLESLRLNNRQINFRRSQYYDPTPLALSPKAAPRLKSLTLTTTPMSWDVFRFPDLTRLELAYHAIEMLPSFHQFIAMLSASPNLSELILKGGSGPFMVPLSLSDIDHIESISLPSLRYLEFTAFRSAIQLMVLTKLIHTPNLESFHIEDFFEDSFDACVSAFGCSSWGYTIVKHFSMTSIEGTSALAFRTALVGMVNVEHLALRCNAKPRNHALYCLTPLRGAAQQTIIMPRLKTFQFTSIPAADIAEMLEARRDAGYPIDRLLIHRESNFTPPEIERLGGAVEIGLEYFDAPFWEDEGDIESESDSAEEDSEESTGDDSSGSEDGE
ncbi:hypothetical protein BS47DRAFT_1340690 [Hydnum rufescens UP504]|uniref:F-box domain-containing protein n=1 Tax=Hydnum rufescens UP504 TaxID=1448309 RepID=A0A9P6B2W5_9AGAM|nr:hypothetical protein BS47DRAFT_1340690 [Hydnum rufescens UP504]